MFYDKQSKEQKEAYKHMLSVIGSLSNLFSESESPMLYYRAHENCFCRYFDADNLARHDCSADAVKERVGIGLKTWVGGNIQKVAEFGKLRSELDGLNDHDLIVKVAEFRNSRIKTTMKMYGLEKMIYHVVIRTDNCMNINETSFDMIDIDKIKPLPERDKVNTRYFTDGKHTYNYNISKSTLYMVFDNLVLLDTIDVKIINDPFEYIERVFPCKSIFLKDGEQLIRRTNTNNNRKLALKLFKETKHGCLVEEKSGLNIWNAAGRKRDPNEIYIPFNKKDREKLQNQGFFPPVDKSFDLELPDKTHITAKICQDSGKAIMSNPNKALGKWLLRDVLDIPEGTVVTYGLLQEKGFDTVVFEKIDDEHYKINFTDSKYYDELYG